MVRVLNKNLSHSISVEGGAALSGAIIRPSVAQSLPKVSNAATAMSLSGCAPQKSTHPFLYLKDR